MTITQGSKVSIHYTLTDSEGEVLDSSRDSNALLFTAGAGEIIPGLEQALLGKEKGDHIEVTIPPEQAYGEYHDAAIQSVPRAQLSSIPDLQVGMPLQAETAQGIITVFVKELTEDNVIIDGNHPLAGETLHFSVDIEEVINDDVGQAAPKIILPK